MSDSKNVLSGRTRIERREIRVLVATFTAVAAFYFWTATTTEYRWVPAANLIGYYDLLGRGFLSGHLSLPVQPNPQLLALPDPYDPAANSSLRLHDASLFNNRYYLYFGPTPALVFFIPFRLITGLDLPEPIVIGFCCSMGLLFAFLVCRRVATLSLQRRPSTWVSAVALITLGLSSAAPFLLRRPMVYEVAISTGYAFAFASIWSFLIGGVRDRPRLGWLWLGSSLLGFAAGARLPMAVVGLVPVVIAAYWLKGSLRRTAADTVALLAALFVPFTIAAALLGFYNYARFGSWTEFGINFALQGVSVKSYRLFEARRLLYGFAYYILVPPRLTRTFPFAILAPAQMIPPPAYLGLEPVAGIVATTPMLISLAFVPVLRREMRSIGLVATLVSVTIGTTMLVLFASAGMTMRYEVDFATFFLVPALLMWYAMLTSNAPVRFLGGLLPATFVGLCVFGGLLQICLSFTGYYDNLHRSHPQVYAHLRLWSAPIELALGAPQLRISDISNPNGIDSYENEPILWLGGSPTQLTIFSRRAQTVRFTAEFIPQTAAEGSLFNRHVRMKPTEWRTAHEFLIEAGVESVSFHVPGGESTLSIEAADPWRTGTAQGDDRRPLIVGMRRWRVEPFDEVATQR